MSCPQIWNIEQEKDREKEKVGGRPAKLNEKKGDRDLELEVKNKGDIFLLEEQHETFVVACIASETRREHTKKKEMRGEGEGSEGNACPQTPRFRKTAFAHERSF